MKIGVLTYHHVINSGSILQTYCTYKLIQNLYPQALVEIIDYYPEDSQKFNQPKLKTKEGKRTFKMYQDFLKKYCAFSSYQLRTDDLKTAQSKINSAGYDLVFVGSDTVFQYNGFLGNYIAGPKAPNIYYLPWEASYEKIGFAVSFDPPEPIEPDLKPILSKYLNDFNKIFYRDVYSEKVLKSLNISKGKLSYIPDPTILLDLRGIYLSTKTNEPASRCLGIQVYNKKMNKVIQEFVDSIGYKSVDITKKAYQNIPRGFMAKNHFQNYISSYGQIDGLITDRFHGTIQGVQYGHYPIVGIEKDNIYKKPESKLRDLYERLNISKALVRTEKEFLIQNELHQAWAYATENIYSAKLAMAKLRTQGFENIYDQLKNNSN